MIFKNDFNKLYQEEHFNGKGTQDECEFLKRDTLKAQLQTTPVKKRIKEEAHGAGQKSLWKTQLQKYILVGKRTHY